MPNKISVCTPDLMYKSVDLSQVQRFKPTTLGVLNGGATILGRRLAGHRTRLRFYGGCEPRTGDVFHRASDDFWFVATTKHGFHSGEPDYFELTRSEAVVWLTANGYEPPEAPSKPEARPEPKPTEAPDPTARPRRMKGDTDARAVAALAQNPGLSNEQIAVAIDCHVKTLSNPTRCPKFLMAREATKKGRERFRNQWA